MAYLYSQETEKADKYIDKATESIQPPAPLIASLKSSLLYDRCRRTKNQVPDL